LQTWVSIYGCPCDVWSTVKFHDPQLMLREVDWDGALVRAIPKVREAPTSDQLAGVIGSMRALRSGYWR